MKAPSSFSWTALSVGALGLLLLISCGRSVVHSLDPAQVQAWLPYLKDGKTTRSEVEAELGTVDPGATFQDGRIVSYLLVRKHNLVYQVSHREAEYELIFVFDDRDVLVRHSLLKIK